MATTVSAIPILPGKLDTWRRFCAELQGPRQAEHMASRRRLGVTVERAYYQQTPHGDLALIYTEAADMGRALQELGASQDPFDVWFRAQVSDIHGWDMTQPPPGPPPEQVVDLQVT